MKNSEIARMFEQMAELLEIQGANSFRVRAYRTGAQTIADRPEQMADLIAAKGNPESIAGIGKDLATKIKVIVETGELPQLTDLKNEVPPGVVEMLRIESLGPKKVAALWKEMGIVSIDQLKAACESGDVAKLKGFGAKTTLKILEGIAIVETAGTRFDLGEAKFLSDTIVADLKNVPGVHEVCSAGSLRRWRETVGDLDVLATADDSTAAMNALSQHMLVEKVLSRGETKQRVRLRGGIEMDLRVVPAESYGAALQYFTGSKEHNIVVRRRALERGLKVNEYGVFNGDTSVAGRTEEEVYAAIDLPWIPPELRENRGEIEKAEQKQLPRLVETADILGDLHMHTTATDGTATIREMIDAAKARGLKYIAITDHSKRVSMANGLDGPRLRLHWEAIEKIRNEFDGIQVLKGIECDILEDATLDLPDDVLAEAEWVIAVLHYGLRQPQDQIMARLMTAVRHPSVSIIGHPQARYIGKRGRPPVAMDMKTFLKAAADHGKMLEINAHPSRLDLDDISAAAARDMGIPIVISTDSHAVTGFDVLPFGVSQARRAGLEPKDVANTKPWEEFKKLLRIV
jgi:DNA polymerase (family 10)